MFRLRGSSSCLEPIRLCSSRTKPTSFVKCERLLSHYSREIDLRLPAPRQVTCESPSGFRNGSWSRKSLRRLIVTNFSKHISPAGGVDSHATRSRDGLLHKGAARPASDCPTNGSWQIERCFAPPSEEFLGERRVQHHRRPIIKRLSSSGGPSGRTIRSSDRGSSMFAKLPRELSAHVDSGLSLVAAKGLPDAGVPPPGLGF